MQYDTIYLTHIPSPYSMKWTCDIEAKKCSTNRRLIYDRFKLARRTAICDAIRNGKQSGYLEDADISWELSNFSASVNSVPVKFEDLNPEERRSLSIDLLNRRKFSCTPFDEYNDITMKIQNVAIKDNCVTGILFNIAEKEKRVYTEKFTGFYFSQKLGDPSSLVLTPFKQSSPSFMMDFIVTTHQICCDVQPLLERFLNFYQPNHPVKTEITLPDVYCEHKVFIRVYIYVDKEKVYELRKNYRRQISDAISQGITEGMLTNGLLWEVSIGGEINGVRVTIKDMSPENLRLIADGLLEGKREFNVIINNDHNTRVRMSNLEVSTDKPYITGVLRPVDEKFDHFFGALISFNMCNYEISIEPFLSNDNVSNKLYVDETSQAIIKREARPLFNEFLKGIIAINEEKYKTESE